MDWILIAALALCFLIYFLYIAKNVEMSPALRTFVTATAIFIFAVFFIRQVLPRIL